MLYKHKKAAAHLKRQHTKQLSRHEVRGHLHANTEAE